MASKLNPLEGLSPFIVDAAGRRAHLCSVHTERHFGVAELQTKGGDARPEQRDGQATLVVYFELMQILRMADAHAILSNPFSKLFGLFDRQNYSSQDKGSPRGLDTFILPGRFMAVL